MLWLRRPGDLSKCSLVVGSKIVLLSTARRVEYVTQLARTCFPPGSDPGCDHCDQLRLPFPLSLKRDFFPETY